MFSVSGEMWEILIAVSTTRGIYWLLALRYLEAENETCARMHCFILSVLCPVCLKPVRLVRLEWVTLVVSLCSFWDRQPFSRCVCVSIHVN